MQQREEKQLEAAVDSLISHVGQTKNALQSFIFKLENEYERLTWPNVLDNFGLLSGQLNTINKMLKNEKTPSFRSQVIIPLLLSQKPDSDLTTLTEQRVQVFSHEIVPDYLRTKPDPEVEEQEKQLSAEAARIGPDVAQKQIQALNKMCSNLLEKLNNPRDDRDAESAASRLNKPSFNPGDTNALVAAVAFGKGLSKCRPPGPMAPGHPGQGPMMSGGPTLQQVTIGGGGGQQAGMGGPVAPQQQGQPAEKREVFSFFLLILADRGKIAPGGAPSWRRSTLCAALFRPINPNRKNAKQHQDQHQISIWFHTSLQPVSRLSLHPERSRGSSFPNTRTAPQDGPIGSRCPAVAVTWRKSLTEC